MSGLVVLAGEVWNGDSFEEGYVVLDDGIVAEFAYGPCPHVPTVRGCIMPGIVDGHTHLGDSGLRLDRRYGLEELVAPPDGLKHRYLRETPKGRLFDDMRSYHSRLVKSGVSRVIDFREGGVEGASLMREACPDSVILGRPISEEYDSVEMDAILDIADGIGIPSVSDLPRDYIDAIADHVKRRNKMLALHVSERVREDMDYVLSLDPDMLVHMVKAEDADMRKCADRDIPVAVCTTSNGYFGMVPPVKRMIDHGITVAVGTDNGMLFPSADIFDEMTAFWSVMSSQGGSKDDAFRSLIAHGRKILYGNSLIEEQTGRRADLIAFPTDSDSILEGDRPKPIRYGP